MNKAAFKPMLCAIAAIMLALGTATTASAQQNTYPNRPVKVIVPYAVGGATDVLARVTMDALSKALGQPFTIENRAGAGVVVGSSFVANAPPDGYTLLVTTSAHSINPTLFRKLPYDSDKDFEPIAILGQVSFVLIASPKLTATDLASLIDLLKKNPDAFSYGSAGMGSPMHVGPELLKTKTGVKAVHVPYKGEAAAINDLLGGHIAFMYSSPANAAPHVLAGKVKPIAVTSARRSSLLPNVPTLAEQGISNADTASWIVLMAPARTAPEIVELISREIAKVQTAAELKARMNDLGFEIGTGAGPQETRAFIKAEEAKWAPIVRASGAVVE